MKHQPRPEIIEEIVLHLAQAARSEGLSHDDVIQIIADNFEWTVPQAHTYFEGLCQGPLPREIFVTSPAD